LALKPPVATITLFAFRISTSLYVVEQFDAGAPRRRDKNLGDGSIEHHIDVAFVEVLHQTAYQEAAHGAAICRAVRAVNAHAAGDGDVAQLNIVAQPAIRPPAGRSSTNSRSSTVLFLNWPPFNVS
jgi:hypothetical protein